MVMTNSLFVNPDPNVWMSLMIFRLPCASYMMGGVCLFSLSCQLCYGWMIFSLRCLLMVVFGVLRLVLVRLHNVIYW